MKTLYIECGMGAAGDMLMGALLELHPDREGFLARMNRLGLPGVAVRAESAVRCGITGTRVEVTVNGQEEESLDQAAGWGHGQGDNGGHDHHHDEGCHADHDIHDYDIHDYDGNEHDSREDHGRHQHSHHHHHAGMAEIEHLIGHLDLPEKVRQDAAAVYGLIAEAESQAHGKPVSQIHFHEVGTLDAAADIAGVCLLISELAPERILCSPVHVGSGQVRCAHGILPVPAPATAHILRGVPIYGGGVSGELCTPTGAALLRHFASDFTDMPVMRVEKIGYGMGKKEFETANCVRALLGETRESAERICELCCNLDDMTPEALGFASERLMEEGALDVYTTAVQMKKNRPAVVLTCMCREEDREAMLRLMFQHTTTLGVREAIYNRYTLRREESVMETRYGAIRVKKANGWGVSRSKPEYEDLARVARENHISLAEAVEEINRQRE